MPHSIFINYRRSDTSSDAGRIHEALERRFGEESVFLDIDDIEIGTRWKKVLDEAGQHAKILLVLIGDQWLEKVDGKQARIFNEEDWVRLEIEAALEKNMVVVPVLLKGARLPSENDLPPSIKALLDHQGIELRYNRWEDDMRYLTNHLCKIYKSSVQCYWYANKIKIGLTSLTICALAFVFHWLGSKPPKPPITVKKSCVAFEYQEALKTILFPVVRDEVQNNDYLALLDSGLKSACEPSIKTEIKYADINTQSFSSAQRDSLSRTCGADLYLKGIQYNNQLLLSFGFIDDRFSQLMVDENLELTQSSFALNQMTSGLQQSYEKTMCLIAGLYAFKKNKFQEAINHLKNCRGLDSSTMVKSILADSYIKTDQIDSSLVYLDQLHASNPDSLEILLKTAAVAKKAKKTDKAIVTYTEALKKKLSEKTEARILEQRGAQYEIIKDLQKSKLDYEKSKAKHPSNGIDEKIKQVDTKIIQEKAIIKPVAKDYKLYKSADQVSVRSLDAAIQIGNYNLANKMISALENKGVQSDSLQALKMEVKLSNQVVIDPALVSPQSMKLIESSERLKVMYALKSTQLKNN